VKLKAAGNGILLCIAVGSWLLLLKCALAGGELDIGYKQYGFGLGFARVAFSFCTGILICRLHHFYQKRSVGHSHWSVPILIVLLLVTILYSPFGWMHTNWFRLTSVTTCFPAIVYFGASVQLRSRLVGPSTAFGEMSYPLYMLHYQFVNSLYARHLMRFAASHGILSNFGIVCLIAIIAYASWWTGEHIDMPVRRFLAKRYSIYELSKKSPAMT